VTTNAIEKATEQGIEAIDAPTVRKFICANASDTEIGLFLQIAKAYDLNPFKREIYLVKYGSYPAATIVGYETYLKRAERTGKLDGWDIEIDGDPPEASATITIYRKDRGRPIKWTAYFEDAVKLTRDGAVTEMWRKWKFMLRKVAIAQGMRLAFPDELGGLPYTEDELDANAQVTTAVVVETGTLTEKIKAASTVVEQKKEPKATDLCTPDDRRRLFSACKAAGYSEEDVRDATVKILNDPNGSTKSLTVAQVNQLCAAAEAKTLLPPTAPADGSDEAHGTDTPPDAEPEPTGQQDDDIPFGDPNGPTADVMKQAGEFIEKVRKPTSKKQDSAPVSAKAALGRYVARARADAGVAPAILAKALSVTPAVLSGLEQGQVAFTKEQALAAAKCLDLHPDDILAIGGFAVESDNKPDNQPGKSHESNGKDSQRGLSFKR
jgi:phage recombination protein Bet